MTPLKCVFGVPQIRGSGEVRGFVHRFTVDVGDAKVIIQATVDKIRRQQTVGTSRRGHRPSEACVLSLQSGSWTRLGLLILELRCVSYSKSVPNQCIQILCLFRRVCSEDMTMLEMKRSVSFSCQKGEQVGSRITCSVRYSS